MAGRACLILSRLVVRRSCWQSRSREVWRWRVALQAQRIHAGTIDQPRIGSAVREVASRAAFRFDYEVLIDKRSSRLTVALRADRIHLCRRSQILAIERSVRIVAVCALHQPFFHLVMERHVELRFRFRVALEAELVLIRLQQLLTRLAVMNAMATDTAHFVFAMRCAFEVSVLPLMAAQTARVDLLR